MATARGKGPRARGGRKQATTRAVAKRPPPPPLPVETHGGRQIITVGGVPDDADFGVTKMRATAPRDDERRVVQISRMPTVTGVVDYDRVGQVKGVLKGFEEGSTFEGAAGLADSMKRDDRIFAGFQKRSGALVGSPIEIKPAADKKLAKKIVEVLGGNDDFPALWHEMHPRAAIKEMNDWARLVGIAIGEMVWNFDNPDFVKYTVRVWHPQFLKWNHQRAVLTLRTLDGEIDLPNIETNVHSDGKWIIYAPYGIRAPWRNSLLRPLAMQYLARQWTYRDMMRFSEKYGMPADVLEIPSNAPPAEKQSIAMQVANRGSEPTIVVPAAGKDEAGYKLNIVQTAGAGGDLFEKNATKVETNIAVLINGQNLTTEVQSIGSFAASKVHEGVEARILLEDAGIMETLRQQGLWHWTERNYGNADELTPFVRYIIEEPEDEQKAAETLQTLGLAITSLQMSGIEVDIRAMAELWGIPVIPPGSEPEDDGVVTRRNEAKLSADDLSKIITVNEARAAMNLPALTTESGALDPEGNLTVAEWKAKHAPRVAPALPGAGDGSGGGDGEGGQGGGPPAPGDPNANDPNQDGGKPPPDAGVERLTKRANKTVARIASKQGPMLAGHKRLAKYADALKKSAKADTAAALSHDLAKVNEIINKAKTPAELRTLLKQHYKASRPEAMARIVERASILAHLAGRMSVLEEV